MLHRLCHQLCQQFDISLLYNSRVGIKCTHQLVRSERFTRLVRGEVFQLPADELRLGFDALKDHHTLLGAALKDSPHCELVEALQSGKDIGATRYALRMAEGTLDFRPARKSGAGAAPKLRERCAQAIAAARAGNARPVMTADVAGRHHIIDGKHRAAVCAWLGAPVRCVDASLVLQDSFYWWVCRRMRRSPAEFRKHIQWFESLETP